MCSLSPFHFLFSSESNCITQAGLKFVALFTITSQWIIGKYHQTYIMYILRKTLLEPKRPSNIKNFKRPWEITLFGFLPWYVRIASVSSDCPTLATHFVTFETQVFGISELYI